MICLAGTIFMIVMICMSSTNKFERFKEAFSGLRETRAAKIYILISMFLRKILYISFMLALMPTLSPFQILEGIGRFIIVIHI